MTYSRQSDRLVKILSMFLTLAIICTQLPICAKAEASSSIPTLDTTVADAPVLYANGTPITIKKDTDSSTCAVYNVGEGEQKVTLPDAITVYGGSQGVATTASSSITVESGTIKQIYGGGKTTSENSSQIDNARLSGSVNIIISGGAVTNNIYGGGYGSDILGNVNIMIDNAVIGGTVFGSSLGNIKRTLTYIGTEGDDSTGKVSIQLNNTTVSTVYAGAAGGSMYGSAEIVLNDTTVTNIYGGKKASNGYGGNLGSFSAVLEGSSAVTEGGTIAPFAYGDVTGTASVGLNDTTYRSVVKIPDGKTVIVTGGKSAEESIPSEEPVLISNVLYANGTPITIKQDTDGKTYVYDEAGTNKLLTNALISGVTVYGGLSASSALESVPSTSVTMHSGTVISNIYGGGKKPTTGTASITMSGGTVKNIYGGSYITATAASQAYTERVKISVNGDAKVDNIYAGGHTCVTGFALTTVTGGTIGNIYGGMAGNSKYAIVSGTTNIVVSGGTILGDIYGAGLQTASITNDRGITIENGADFIGYIYPCRIGGTSGNASVVVPINFDADRIVVDTDAQKRATTVNGVPLIETAKPENPSDTIEEQKVTSSGSLVFANGVSIRIKQDRADEKTYIYDISSKTKLLDTPVDNAKVFGGSNCTTVENTEIIMESGFVYSLYGGGFGGRVTGTAKIIFEKDANASHSVVGGGDVGLNSKGEEVVLAITENAEVIINGGFAGKYVGAGGYKAITKNAKVIFNDGVTQGLTAGTRSSEYDADFNQITGNTEIIMNNGSVISIYGGCEAAPVEGNVTITVNGGTIEGAIYPLGNTARGSDVKGTATVNVYDGLDSTIEDQDQSNVTVTKSGTKNTEMSALIPDLPTVHDKEAVISLNSATSDTGNLVFRFLEMRVDGESRADAVATKTGDSIFVTFPNGENMLVDAGISGTADTVVSDLKALGVETIDSLWVTHYHADHGDGIPAILNNFNVKNIYISGFEIDGGVTYATVQNAIKEHTASLSVHYFSNKTNCETVRQVTVGEGNKQVVIDVLNPVINQTDPGTGEASVNNSSLVLKLTYGENSALLTGDIYEEQEAVLVQAGLGKVDLLKVPHHGITSSSSINFIRAVSPTVAVITNMQYKYTPVLSTVHKYQSAGIEPYVTGLYGSLKITMDGKKNPLAETEWKYETKPEEALSEDDKEEITKNHSSTVPINSTFVSDTTSDFNANGAYQFKITSTNGQIPTLVVGTSGVFNVEITKVVGSDYYFKVTVIGAPGEQAGIYINGSRILIATIASAAATMKSDTTLPFIVKAGAAYTFKLTAESKPTLIAGTSSVFKVQFVNSVGKDYFFRVTAVGKSGAACGFYTNSQKIPVTVATITR